MTTKSQVFAIAVASFAAGAVGLALPAVALAEGEAGVQQLGQQGKLIDGGNVAGWTVIGLQPSSDAIPFAPRGTLWEVTATEEAIAGGALPFIPDFVARAANGESYNVLFQVPSAQGVNPSGLAQGQSVTGKLYFDVTGAAPDSVVYGNRLTWVQPPPGAPAAGSSPSSNGGAGQRTYTNPQTGSAAGAAGTSGVSGAQSGTGASAAGAAGSAEAAPGAASSGGAAQSTPVQTQPAPAQGAPQKSAAPDDVQGSATAAQPTPTAAPLDVHDTAVPTTTPSAPASQGTAPAPTATAPAPASTPAPAAAATPAASAPAAPMTVVPAPSSSTTGG